ncbi:acetylxylan esterase, partial [Bacillus velezensis]|uniref:acetylxylan esterase n=1 Tax=Bacillus velezensis TaxID=492670 RepID=UPI0021B5FBEB
MPPPPLSHIPTPLPPHYPYLTNFHPPIDVPLHHPYLHINSFFTKNRSPETQKPAINTLPYFDIINLP